MIECIENRDRLLRIIKDKLAKALYCRDYESLSSWEKTEVHKHIVFNKGE